MVNAITIHRDFVNGAIVRSDVFVTPVKVSFVSLSSFRFESCVFILTAELFSPKTTNIHVCPLSLNL